MIIDRLYEEVNRLGNVCVGLDTDFSYIPKEYSKRFSDEGECILAYNKELIDALKDKCAVFKVQISYYEALGIKGMKVYSETLKYIRECGKLSIGDVKRGDISKTAEKYAIAHFEGDFECDFITVNPYMGSDTLQPYFHYIKERDKGLFPLIRTSNPGARDLQYEKCGEDMSLYERAGKMIYNVGKKFVGDSGYSSIGGVVGCTDPEDSRKIREEFKGMFFLIPGYGAQGGDLKTIKNLLQEGNGGIVNSSRGVLMAYKKYENGRMRPVECAVKEVEKMREAINGEKHGI